MRPPLLLLQAQARERLALASALAQQLGQASMLVYLQQAWRRQCDPGCWSHSC